MSGPAPQPTALRLLRGNPGKRAINRNEPVFTGTPQCPSWLTPTAQAEWDRVTDDLRAMDMLRGVDAASLAAYCQAFARWQQAEETVTKEGQTISEPIVNKSGDVVGYKVKRHPVTTIAKDERAAMLRAAALFGFDPSSRSRINLGDVPPVDSFDQFMKSAGSTIESKKKYKEISG